MTHPIAISMIGVRNRASFNGAGATTVDMAAFGESAQKWAVARDGQSSKQRPNEAERRARPIIISADHVRSPGTLLLASVVIPTRQKVLDVKSRLMTCAYILERISSRSPQ